MASQSYQVTGMTCAHCVAAVTAELTALPGVTGVTVDLDSGEVAVTSVAALSRSEVAEAVDEAGYVLTGAG